MIKALQCPVLIEGITSELWMALLDVSRSMVRILEGTLLADPISPE
jgi:hypothetical protein